MNVSFAEALRRLRIKKGLSQQQLSELLHVDRSTIAKWETGDRLPDAAMISRLSECLGADITELLYVSERDDETPKVILVDDERIIVDGSIPVLKEALPDAEVRGFTVPAEAMDYVKNNRVALVFLDIEMGRINGLDVCREMREIAPRANVIYLTAYREYSFDAWSTGACGFLLKPLTVGAVKASLSRLRYPIRGLDRR
ncbi:MAG: response regulator [Clostridia bacterium]|nr:response regulator [Clostridia bacterium]